MNKNVLSVLSVLCIISLSAMEKTQFQESSFSLGKTIIKLKKGNIYTIDGQIDIIVVGNNYQKMLEPYDNRRRKKDDRMLSIVGYIHQVSHNNIKVISPNDDSASDDEKYKPFFCFKSDEKQLRAKAYNKELKSSIIRINEPYIMPTFSEIDNPYYYSIRREKSRVEQKMIVVKKDGQFFIEKDVTERSESIHVAYEGKQALIEAAKDLMLCYEKVLHEGKNLENKEVKSIALPILSVDIGFPRREAAAVVVKSVIEFIKANPEAYSIIELYVKKRFEFELYKKLFEVNLKGI